MVICELCEDDVQARDLIWNCSNCHAVLHLSCAQTQTKHLKGRRAVWSCVVCEYDHSDPPVYSCYCGKMKDPASADPFGTVHSCGEPCGRIRPDCGHKCTSICHSGDCDVCPSQNCRVLRSKSKLISSSTLPCGHPRPVIPGPCTFLVDNIRCSCGKSVLQVPCHLQSSPQYCMEPCGKLLKCGNHYCQVNCHAPGNDCPECPLLVAAKNGCRTCPCGKTNFRTESCSSDAPVCVNQCDKVLNCGVHKCRNLCHVGPCLDCKEQVIMMCRCGSKEFTVACGALPAHCRTKCEKRLNCGVHTCNIKCCNDCPPCVELCNRPLGCKRHKCPLYCHGDTPCPPCSSVETLTCACGTTSRTIRCVRIKRLLEKSQENELYKLVACDIPCSKHLRSPSPPSKAPSLDLGVSLDENFFCRHIRDGLNVHSCHGGPCVCAEKCGRLKPCGHSCSLKCHDRTSGSIAPSTAVLTTSVPSVNPPFFYDEICKFPCLEMVELTCVGQHGTFQRKCTDAAIFTCSAKCGVVLACGKHSCEKSCHYHSSCDVDEIICPRKCDELKSCGVHKCTDACHAGPCDNCDVKFGVPCFCGSTSLTVECGSPHFRQIQLEMCYQQKNSSTTSFTDRVPTVPIDFLKKNFPEIVALGDDVMRYCRVCGKDCPKRLSCGHVCGKPCHPGSCEKIDGSSGCSFLVSLKCKCRNQAVDVKCSELIKSFASSRETVISGFSVDLVKGTYLIRCNPLTCKSKPIPSSSASKNVAGKKTNQGVPEEKASVAMKRKPIVQAEHATDSKVEVETMKKSEPRVILPSRNKKVREDLPSSKSKMIALGFLISVILVVIYYSI